MITKQKTRAESKDCKCTYPELGRYLSIATLGANQYIRKTLLNLLEKQIGLNCYTFSTIQSDISRWVLYRQLHWNTLELHLDTVQ